MEQGIPVERYRLTTKDSDGNVVLGRYYLRQTPGSCRTCTIDTIASEIETLGSLSSEDVAHVVKAFVRKLRENLTKGNKVKVTGLGTFQVTFNTTGADEEKDCTVKNINTVNIRFAVANTLRLANNSTATTRSAPNNVQFYLQGETALVDGSEEGEGGEDEAPN